MKINLLFLNILSTFIYLVNCSSLAIGNNSKIPIIVYGGLGDSTLSKGLKELMSTISLHYNTPVFGISISDNENEDRKLSALSNANDNVEMACQKLRQNFNEFSEVNAIGLSQGGLFLRSIIEQCDNIPKIKNLVTFGTPHMGIEKLPACRPRDWLCYAFSAIAKMGVYSDYAQLKAVVAQYFRDPQRYLTYLQKSNWLADINNEKILLDNKNYNQNYGVNLSSLNSLTAVMFTKDTMVQPKESAWFYSSQVSSNYETYTPSIVKLEQQPIYIHPSDPLGLRKLNENGRLILTSCEGEHLHLNEKTCLFPVLDQAFGWDGESESTQSIYTYFKQLVVNLITVFT